MLADPIGLRRLGKLSTPGPLLVIANPKLQSLHGLWQTQRGGALLPNRAAFDACALRHWLGHVALIDVLSDPVQFRVRLHGAKLADLQGRDLTGRLLDESFDGPKLDAVLDPFHACLNHRSPIAFSRRYDALYGTPYVLEQLLLPCSSDQVAVDLIIGAAYLVPASALRAHG